MTILEKIKNGFTYFDGGTGTVLQKKGLVAGELPEEWNLTHPEEIVQLHLDYINAGSHIINTNTFGANILKFSKEKLEQIITAAVENALEAKRRSGREDVWIALDIGPSGKLLKPYGTLDFEDAVFGLSKEIKIDHLEICPTCKGTGVPAFTVTFCAKAKVLLITARTKRNNNFFMLE